MSTVNPKSNRRQMARLSGMSVTNTEEAASAFGSTPHPKQGLLLGGGPVQPHQRESPSKWRNTREQMPRLDIDADIRRRIMPHCRLRPGDIWKDDVTGHRVGVLDATSKSDVDSILGSERPELVVADPPYNFAVGNGRSMSLRKRCIDDYLSFCRQWVANAAACMSDDAHFYVWIGADYRNGFQPLADFIILMRSFDQLEPRNFISLRSQRGYGSQKNWMWLRQELLYYRKGKPHFNIEAEYTEIPRVLKGYYKDVGGRITENSERSKSDCIRAGNIWVDIQQVFYRLEENVPGCYAQKPLKAIQRIVSASSQPGELVLDCFGHSGTTLVAGESLGRRVYTFDIDPVFAEIMIRRLERLRRTGKTGWQWMNPFPEVEF